MKKMFNKAVLNGTTVMGDGLTYPRIPNVYTGDNEGGYQRGDMMDANAVVEMIKELTDTGEITIEELQNLINEEIQERVEGDQDQQRYTDEKIKDLIGTSPETLDTLREIADALGEDPDFAANVWNKIAELTTKHNEDVQELQDAITSGFENIDFTPYVKKTDVVTDTTNGLMLASDKVKLDAFGNATKYKRATALPKYILGKNDGSVAVATTHLPDKFSIDFIFRALEGGGVMPQSHYIYPATNTKAGVMSSSDKVKLDSIESGAQVNKIESISVNGTPLEVTDKGIDIPNATTEKDGMMSANDKSKLDYLANEETLAYGVEWDTTSSDPHLTRIGNMSFHKTLPIQSQLKGCIALKDKVIYWLNESDWRFRKEAITKSVELTVAGDVYTIVADIFNTLQYDKLWVKVNGVACQINSINTSTNTATLLVNDDLKALSLLSGTKSIELGAVLNGYDGTVRVYCPNFYIKSVIDGTKRRVWISTIKIDNSYTHQPEILIDAYRSTVLNAVPSNMGYLSTLPVNSAISVVNTHDYCRGGENRSSYDTYLETDPSRSDLCKPRTNLPRATMRTYSRSAGSEMLSYDLYKNIFYWLYIIEYANFNCQEAYNEAVTAEGYKQGGLGAGVTTIYVSDWENYNGLNPLTPCGYCNELGNGTGLKTMTVVATTTYNFSVPRWRGFDNPFGDIWTNLDGIIILGDAAGNPKTVYTTTDPNNYGDNESAKNAMEIAGHEIHQDGYTKEFDLGDAAHIIPESVGGDTTKYKCDYHLAGYKDTSLSTLFVGGIALNGATAGLGDFGSFDNVSSSHLARGFRSVSTFVSFSE